MSRTPNTLTRTFQIRSNGLFKKGNTLFNMLHPRVMILIQPAGAISGSSEPLAYSSHGQEEWPELYDFFEASGISPRKVFGPDDFDTVAARQSSTPKHRTLIQEQHRDTPFPDMLQRPDFLRSGPESLSSDSTALSETASISHLTAGIPNQISESLRATPVPDMTSLHPLDETEHKTDEEFDQSLFSLFNDSLDQSFEPQPPVMTTQRLEQRMPEATPHKRKANSGTEGPRKRRSIAGSEDRDRRRKMMTRSQGHSFYRS